MFHTTQNILSFVRGKNDLNKISPVSLVYANCHSAFFTYGDKPKSFRTYSPAANIRHSAFLVVDQLGLEMQPTGQARTALLFEIAYVQRDLFFIFRYFRLLNFLFADLFMNFWRL